MQLHVVDHLFAVERQPLSMYLFDQSNLAT